MWDRQDPPAGDLAGKRVAAVDDLAGVLVVAAPEAQRLVAAQGEAGSFAFDQRLGADYVVHGRLPLPEAQVAGDTTGGGGVDAVSHAAEGHFHVQ